MNELTWEQEKAFKQLEIIGNECPVSDIDSFGYVYHLINKSNTIVYIGQTDNLKSRITYHFNEGVKDFIKFTASPIRSKELNRIEALEIVYWKPIYNLSIPANTYFFNLFMAYDFWKNFSIKENIKDALNKTRNFIMGITKYWCFDDLYNFIPENKRA